MLTNRRGSRLPATRIPITAVLGRCPRATVGQNAKLNSVATNFRRFMYFRVLSPDNAIIAYSNVIRIALHSSARVGNSLDSPRTNRRASPLGHVRSWLRSDPTGDGKAGLPSGDVAHGFGFRSARRNSVFDFDETKTARFCRAVLLFRSPCCYSPLPKRRDHHPARRGWPSSAASGSGAGCAGAGATDGCGGL